MLSPLLVDLRKAAGQGLLKFPKGFRKKNLASIARAQGGSVTTLYKRVKAGWDPARAAVVPICRYHPPLQLTFRGETLSREAWARRVGLAPSTLWMRLKCGWTLERALTEPVKHKRPLPFRRWAGFAGMKPTTLRSRLTRLNWPLDRAIHEPVHRKSQVASFPD